MADFNPKCFKCVAEQEKQEVAGGGTAGVCFIRKDETTSNGWRNWWWNFCLWPS